MSLMWKILTYFPIGAQVSFYPEQERENITQSILLAYSLDGRLYYRAGDLIMASSEASALEICTEQEVKRSIDKVGQFYFIIPSHKRSEIDYRRDSGRQGGKLVDRQVNDFRTGNQITLVSSNPENGAPHLETNVKRTTRLKGGYYANQEVVILEPLPDTLVHIDRRSHKRVETQVPATVKFAKGAEDLACFLMDFSEESARIQLHPDVQTEEVIREGKKLVLRFAIGVPEKSYELSAIILRIKASGIVIGLTGIMKGKQFVPLEMIDLLMIKSTLLNAAQKQ